jgi:hypothetical protein
MDVLHYSFSLSACPKCHLLVCKHTSLANLDFQVVEQQSTEHHTTTTTNDHDGIPMTIDNRMRTNSRRYSTNEMNFYIFPSTIGNNRYSWTTFGTNSTPTLTNQSIENRTFDDDIPFANENIISSTYTEFKPRFTHIVRTQSERCQQRTKPSICRTKSYSFSTVYTTQKSIKSVVSSPHIEYDDHHHHRHHRISPTYSNLSLLTLLLLVLSYLLTNTLDIVLLYVYYHINYFYFILFACVLCACDLLQWMNNLIEFRHLPTRLLLVPFLLRFYLLYEMIELMIILLNRHCLIHSTMLDSSSTPSSSTTTTLETSLSQTTQSSLIEHSTYDRTIKQGMIYVLTVFYLTHSSLLAFVNIYFWSHNFQLTVNSSLNMDYFIPQWISDENLSRTTLMNIVPVQSSIQ